MADYATTHPAPREGASVVELQAHIRATRQHLVETLEAVEDKFDIPAHTARLTAAVQVRLRANPLPVLAVGAVLLVGVASVVGGVIAIPRR